MIIFMFINFVHTCSHVIVIEKHKMQVEKESKSVGSKKEDALNRARRRMGVGEITAKVG